MPTHVEGGKPRRKILKTLVAKDLRSEHFISRELSWLDFNARVLEEARDPEVPLLDRLKFLSIFSSNLDEFFMIRVAGVKHQISAGVEEGGADGLTPAQAMAAMSQRIHELTALQHRCFCEEIRPQLEPALRRENHTRKILLVGTGGTTSILARIEAQLDHFNRERIEATPLSLERIKAHRRRLWRLPLAERKEIVGLPKLRADVILTGVVIYEMVMAEFGFEQLRVSTRGLRFAAVMD